MVQTFTIYYQLALMLMVVDMFIYLNPLLGVTLLDFLIQIGRHFHIQIQIHFLNNNLAASFGGGDGSGKEYSWVSVAIAAAVYIILLVLPFIFSKTFSKANTESFVTGMLTPAAEPDSTGPAICSSNEEKASTDQDQCIE